MNLFDQDRVVASLRSVAKGAGWALLTVFIGIFIGFMIAGQNPFLVFWPPTWLHVVEFLS